MTYSIFKAALVNDPDAIAIIDSKKKKYTYQQVEKRVNQWANYFLEQGIKRQNRIVLLTKNEDLQPFIYLAIDKIEATFVPLDVDSPEKQTIEAINNLQPQLILSDTKKIANKTCIELTECLFNDINNQRTYLEHTPYSLDDSSITYIVFSSGSTGSRKAIPIKRKGINSWADTERNLLQLNSGDKVLVTRSPAYDARIFEYILAFAGGSTLCMMSYEERKNLHSLLMHIRNKKINCVILISSQLNIPNLEHALKMLKQAGLKHLMITGEACSFELKEACKNVGIKLWNCYGPTEATFGISIKEITNTKVVDKKGKPFMPIGLPVEKNYKVHVIDGTLYIESDNLSPGYIKSNDNSFTWKKIAGIWRRLFNTGDRVELIDGCIKYLGRDKFSNFCKVSGEKIYPQEVETVLNNYRNINGKMAFDSIVVVKNVYGKTRLHAYLVAKEDINNEHLGIYIKKRLSSAQIPIFYQIGAFPKAGISQKIDRQALIDLNDNENTPVAFVMTSMNENTCADVDKDTLEKVHFIWCSTLALKSIHYDSEFILVGGDSLKLVAIISRLNDAFNQSLEYGDLLKLSKITIREIAWLLKQDKEKKAKVKSKAICRAISPIIKDRQNLFFLPPITGEGYFTYRNLYKKYLESTTPNLYGITDPGLYNKEDRPDSLENAVERYVNAILAVQPDGEYNLSGYSFGGMLAYEVAKALIKRGKSVNYVQLIDAFSPAAYQLLSTEAHLLFFQDLLNFLLPVLNNSYYQERIKPIVLTEHSTTIEKQVKAGFEILKKQVKNEKSICLIKMVERHLKFIRECKIPKKVLDVHADAFFTDKKQYYLSVFKMNKSAACLKGFNYYGWADYFSAISRYHRNIYTSHIGLIARGATKHTAPIRHSWEQAFFTPPKKHALQRYTKPFYMFQSNNDMLNVNCYLLTQSLKEKVVCNLKELINVEVKSFLINESMTARIKALNTRSKLYNLSFLIDKENLPKVKAILENEGVKYQNVVINGNDKTKDDCVERKNADPDENNATYERVVSNEALTINIYYKFDLNINFSIYQFKIQENRAFIKTLFKKHGLNVRDNSPHGLDCSYYKVECYPPKTNAQHQQDLSLFIAQVTTILRPYMNESIPNFKNPPTP